MSTDDTYVPKSPDLSSFYSAGPTEPAPQQPQYGSHGPEYIKPAPPGYGGHPASSSYAPSPPTSHRELNHSPDHYHNHAHAHAPLPHYHQHQPSHQQHSHQQHSHQLAADPIKQEYQGFSPRGQHQFLPPSLDQDFKLPPEAHYAAQPVFQAPPYPAAPFYGQGPPQGDRNHQQYPGSAPYNQQYAPQLLGDLPPHTTTPSAPYTASMPPRKAAQAPAPVVDQSPVRTKFPTARIKRIMQADEEVGKVAQQTPIAVGKALEMFMIHLVSKSADVAREKGSKRVTASMLKQVVETDEQWDFLRDIVSRVEHEKEGKAKAKAESSSDEEMIEPKKKTRGGRKKRVA